MLPFWGWEVNVEAVEVPMCESFPLAFGFSDDDFAIDSGELDLVSLVNLQQSRYLRRNSEA